MDENKLVGACLNICLPDLLACLNAPAVPAEPTREQVRAAVELVCDYLNDEWSKKLMEHCGLTEVRGGLGCGGCAIRGRVCAWMESCTCKGREDMDPPPSFPP